MRGYKANMIPGGVTPTINVSQYDNDYAVTVTLIEGAEIYTPPAGATIRVEGTKPDGHGFEYPCTYQGNVVTMPIYTQMTVVAGRFPIELVVYQNGLRVGSCNIIFAVEKAPLGEDTDISETVIPDIIAGAQAQADAAAASAATASSAETNAVSARDAAIEAAAQVLSSQIVTEASGSIASFSDGADDVAVKSLVAEITPIQSGSGDPSPTNIRPISGRTGMTVTRAGKNLFPSKTISLGGTNPRTLSISLPYTIPAGEYIMLFTVGGTGTGSWGLEFFYGNTTVGVLSLTTRGVTLSAPANRIYAYMAQSDYDAGYTRIIDDIQLELGTVATTYTPYVAPTTYPITWQTEAGTVYGGTLDVVSGVLTVTDALIASYDGETLPSTWISDRDVYAEGTTPTTGAQVVYKLATPQTYRLTPTEVRTLLGGNTIYTDAGSVTVEYVADTKLYIDNKIAELQALVLEN